MTFNDQINGGTFTMDISDEDACQEVLDRIAKERNLEGKTFFVRIGGKILKPRHTVRCIDQGCD